MHRALAVLPVLLATILMAVGPGVQACIPGMPPIEFEPQAVGGGELLTGMMRVTASTQEELFPVAVAHDGRLHVAWQLEDFNQSVLFFGSLASFDGSAWTDPLYLTSHDLAAPVRSSLNVNPRLSVCGDEMLMVWTSMEADWTTGPDEDIVFRHSVDGTNWSDVIEVSSPTDTGMDKLPQAVMFDSRTYFVWETNDPATSDGADLDIVLRSWDGTAFGPVEEVTLPGDKWNDQYAAVAADGEHLYVTWVTNDQSSGKGYYWDVWARVRDREGWLGPPFKVSSDGLHADGDASVVADDGRCFFLWRTTEAASPNDPSAIALRTWDPSAGLGFLRYASSTTTKGEDSHPMGMVRDGALYVVWTTMDSGISYGEDPDVVYRKGAVSPYGDVEFGDFLQISEPTDDYRDQHPSLGDYDGVLYCVWNIDYNYTSLLPPEVLEPLGGMYRSIDVAVRAVEVPFEKSLSIVYSLGTGSPVATLATTADVEVRDLKGEPVTGRGVQLRIAGRGGWCASPTVLWLRQKSPGSYSSEHLVLPRAGVYDITVVVDGHEMASFSVAATAPPPSFVDRVPAASVAFLVGAAVAGAALHRSMAGGRTRPRRDPPAPLDATA